jgi:uncharacterized repeat protein (TIGR01451 family)
MKFIGANDNATIMGEDELPGKSNYIKGSNPAAWYTGISHYAKVRYKDIYPGIDLIFRGNQGNIEYDLIIAQGSDPSNIIIEFNGAQKLRVDNDGNLILHVDGDMLVQHAPMIYQESEGIKQKIPGGYVLKGENKVGFRVAAYDTDKKLIIDPVFVYSTYLGGSQGDSGNAIAVDASGNAYLTGNTNALDFPTTPMAIQTEFGGNSDAFVAKLNPAASGMASLVYATYIGGSDLEVGFGIAVDDTGNAYLTGMTESTDFPTTTGAFQTVLSGDSEAFVIKLNPSGSSLVYSTYLGGKNEDSTHDISIDAEGNAYIAGTTASTDFPVSVDTYQTAFGGGYYDTFVTKLNNLGTELVFSTFIGGNSSEEASSIALDINNNAYVTGWTGSTNFPIQNPFKGSKTAGDHVFVTKLNNSGDGLIYSTYIGAGQAYGIAVDSSGSAYIAGSVIFNDFPTTPGAYQRTCNSSSSSDNCKAWFVSKLDPSGSALSYSTYLGGAYVNDGGSVIAVDIVVDQDGNAYVVGRTNAADFPTVFSFQDTCGLDEFGKCSDAFIAKFNSTGSSLVFSSYIGGKSSDIANGVALSEEGRIYVVGNTLSPDLTMVNGPYLSITPGPNLSDAFFAVISESDGMADLSVSQTDSPDPVPLGDIVTYTIQITNHGPSDATNALLETTLQPEEANLDSVSTSQGSCNSELPLTCSLGNIEAGQMVTVDLAVELFTDTSNKVTVASSELDPDTSDNIAIEDTSVSAPPVPVAVADLSVTVTDSPDPVQASNNVTYTITVVNNGPATAQNVMLNDRTYGGVDIFDLVSVNGGNCSYPTCFGFGCFLIDWEPQRITCNLGDIESGSSRNISMTVKLDPPAGQRSNSASVTSDVPDNDLTNNTDSEPTTVTSSGDNVVWSSGSGGGGGCFISSTGYVHKLSNEILVLVVLFGFSLIILLKFYGNFY